MKKTLIALLLVLTTACFMGLSYADNQAEDVFEPISVREFFKLQDVDAETAVINAMMTDCEEGLIEEEMTEEDREEVIELLEHGIITGKENEMSVTGGTTVYVFRDAEGNYLGSIELYRGLAVGNDGMYSISVLPESKE